MSSRNDATIPYPVDGGYQSASFTATSAAISNAVGDQIRSVALYSDQDCHVVFAKTPVATTSDFFLPASLLVMLRIQPGQKVAAVRASADGTLRVSELTY